MEINQKTVDADIASLKKIIGNLECPMCHNTKFSYVQGFFVDTIQSDEKELKVAGDYIPTISIICDRCGFMSRHAISNIRKFIAE